MSKPKNDLLADYVLSILNYNKDTGLFTWVNQRNKNKRKQYVGYVSENGYIIISIPEGNYRAHRLAWLMYYGKWPKNDIDHINGIRTDNRICNLREVTRRENLQNMAKHRNGKLPGATRVGDRYQSQIQVGKKTIFLGMYDTEMEAHLAYRLANENLESFYEG
jgi:hypothetical protein